MLQLPSFYGSDHFPEPVTVPDVDEIASAGESEGSGPVTTGRVVLGADDDGAPAATGSPRALTAAEYRALEDEAKQLEAERLERLRAKGVHTPTPEEVARFERREMKHGRIQPVLGRAPAMPACPRNVDRRRINQLISWEVFIRQMPTGSQKLNGNRRRKEMKVLNGQQIQGKLLSNLDPDGFPKPAEFKRGMPAAGTDKASDAENVASAKVPVAEAAGVKAVIRLDLGALPSRTCACGIGEGL